MRRRQKFHFIWTVLILLALVVWLRRYILAAGYESFDAFSADAIVFSIRAGFVLVPLAFIYRLRYGRRKIRGWGKMGRTARCYKCKRPLEDHTGARCRFCGWIRCQCGACGCGRGKLI